MNSLKMSCPSCHNTLQVPEDITRLNCMHCGAELYVQKGKGFAALKQVAEEPKPDSKPQEKTRERQQSPLATFAIVIVACIIFSSLGGLLSDDSKSDDPTRSASEAGALSQTNTRSNAESTRTVGTSTPNTATNTPTPTATKTPVPTKTPTPAPVAAGVVLSNSNLRGGPGTSFDVVGSVSKEDELEIFVAREDGAWLKSAAPSQYGSGPSWSNYQ